ncbi:hypothetical protein OIE75_01675 [Streptomyces sp. NBC_01723]|nr:hypothetical protein [Streptomyces sp. NBC_01723]
MQEHAGQGGRPEACRVTEAGDGHADPRFRRAVAVRDGLGEVGEPRA